MFKITSEQKINVNWMELHIYSLKTESQASNIWVNDGQHKKAKVAKYSATDLKDLCILSENSADGLGSRRECWWGYVSL